MKQKRLALRHRLVCALPYEVLHWLITENLLSQFCNNTIDYIKRHINYYCDADRVIRLLEIGAIDSNQIINVAFEWEKTIEGYDFWYRRYNWLKDYLK